MQKSLAFMLVLAASSTAALAQSQYPTATQSLPAPIVRSNPNSNRPNPAYDTPATRQITNSQPIPGVLLRVEPSTVVQTLSADAKGTELRVDHGIANISVHHPEPNVEILVDLPGGQTTLLKDGLYTFNADTNTVRVLKGEAAAYPGPANSDAKPIKIKEDHQLNFATQNALRSVEVNDSRQLTADLLPGSDGNRDNYPARGYGYRTYGDGYYAGYPYPYYPYYPYGYYGYGYPYGYSLGLGFGYYGGFRGYRGGFGGYRGGFGGFRGRR